MNMLSAFEVFFFLDPNVNYDTFDEFLDLNKWHVKYQGTALIS